MKERKNEHIQLALESEGHALFHDKRFDYEPLLGSMNKAMERKVGGEYFGFHFDYPLWVSSMTGGAQYASTINKNLAMACREFGLGMGLGSCRNLLFSEESFEDFNVRKYMGEAPLFTNLGISQLEHLVQENQTHLIDEMNNKLSANGIVIHINPLQEFYQREGDCYQRSPIETIKLFLDKTKTKVIVKEVGQGIGPQSLKELCKLPLAAIETASFGGANFSQIEQLREGAQFREPALAYVGHDNEEILETINQLENPHQICFILSGGVKSSLDGYYLTHKCSFPSLYGQATSLLKYALKSYEELSSYLAEQIKVYKMAKEFLVIKQGSNRG